MCYLPVGDDDGSRSGRQLAVEYHAVGDVYASPRRLHRCSESRGADDVIGSTSRDVDDDVADSADRLLAPQSPRSVAADNARRPAECFDLNRYYIPSRLDNEERQ